jgi:hypothetical protein
MTLFVLGPVFVFACWFGGYSCEAQPGRISVAKSMAAVTPVPAGASQEVSAPVDIVAGACQMIYRGKFVDAGQLAERAAATDRRPIRISSRN